MDFTLSDEQMMFADTARALFAATCTPDHWRRMMEQGVARDNARWASIVETGLCQVMLPESAGGIGLSETDFALIAQEAGYVALPEPLVESAGVAAPMLAALAPGHALLADPLATIAIAHPINPFVDHADSAAAILLEKDGEAYLATPDQVTLMMEQGVARDDARWASIVETGLCQVMLPESAGGIGLSETDFALIAQEAGYVALPEPLVESAGVAAPMLAALAPGHALLADPLATIAIAHPINPFVAHADSAAAILLEKDGEAYLATPDQVTLVAQPSIDPFRRLFSVEWDVANATALGKADWDLALDRAALFAAAQGLGLAQRAVDLAVDYAKERQQFGKPIGSYQAVKHHLASAQVEIEFARPVVMAAAAEIGHRDVQARARVSHAKIVALEAADKAARASIQVHGAMGYSWEVDVHLFLKRALALTQSWGIPAFHRARIARRLFTQPNGPDQTFAREKHNA